LLGGLKLGKVIALECGQSGQEQCGSFAFGRKRPATLLFPKDVSIVPDFKNAAAAANEEHLVSGGILDLSRHTVGFWAVVSLLAIFDFNCHGGIMVK
jgi:hypothetical protein